MKVKSEREVAQSCPTLSNPMHFFFLSCLFSFSFSSMFFKKHLFGCFGSCLQHATFSLHHMGFFTVVQRPEYRGSVVVLSGLSCCTECELLFPRPRFEPTSPAFQKGGAAAASQQKAKPRPLCELWDLRPVMLSVRVSVFLPVK